jgi:serine-type D-Ala-D-Ala carboxypeptidase/endopeptidase
MHQPGVVELADRLARRHVGAVIGTLDLARGHTVPPAERGRGFQGVEPLATEIVGRGRVRLPDGSQPGPDTLFEIGSITKTFTALALAVLAGSGTVSLRTPLGDLLPTGIAVPNRDGTTITLEHLARHTSGLPRSPIPFLSELRMGLRGQNPYDFDEAATLDSLSRVSLKHIPGHGHGGYSNLGGGLLGIALRRAAGRDSYFDLISATVLQPLQLTDTVVHPGAEQAQRLAQGYGLRRRPVEGWYLEGLAGAGALRSTAADMLRYLGAQLEPDRTPLAEAIRLTHQLWEPQRRMTIGLGWIRTKLSGGGEVWWHNGGTGGFRSFAGFSPELGRAAVVLVNDVRSPDRAGLQALSVLRRQPTHRGSGPSGPPA